MKSSFSNSYGAHRSHRPKTEYQDQGQSNQRRRIPVACARCRKRKIKCSGDPGNGNGCQSCQLNNIDGSNCIFGRVGATEVHWCLSAADGDDIKGGNESNNPIRNEQEHDDAFTGQSNNIGNVQMDQNGFEREFFPMESRCISESGQSMVQDSMNERYSYLPPFAPSQSYEISSSIETPTLFSNSHLLGSIRTVEPMEPYPLSSYPPSCMGHSSFALPSDGHRTQRLLPVPATTRAHSLSGVPTIKGPTNTFDEQIRWNSFSSGMKRDQTSRSLPAPIASTAVGSDGNVTRQPSASNALPMSTSAQLGYFSGHRNVGSPATMSSQSNYLLSNCMGPLQNSSPYISGTETPAFLIPAVDIAPNAGNGATAATHFGPTNRRGSQFSLYSYSSEASRDAAASHTSNDLGGHFSSAHRYVPLGNEPPFPQTAATYPMSRERSARRYLPAQKASHEFA